MKPEEEKKAFEICIGMIEEKVLAPLKNKATKEHLKADKKCVTYKGVEYYTPEELFEAYSADEFDGKKHDELLDKLIAKKEQNGAGETKTDRVIKILCAFLDSMKNEMSQIMTEEEEKAYFAKFEEMRGDRCENQ